jgi:hypothetical protein
MKTKLTGESVKAFLDAIPDEEMRKDCREISRLMEAATKSKPRLWGKIVGFGSTTLRYANGKETEWMLIAFAPRAGSIALYLGEEPTYAELKEKLGKHSVTGKGCVHIKKLSDVHVPTLKKLIAASVARLKKNSTRNARC